MTERGSLWGLRLLAVALAVLVWFLATADRRETDIGTTAVPATVNYTTPQQMMILEPIEEVRVRIRGTSSQIQNLNPFQVRVGVDLRNAEKGPHEVNLAPRNVLLPDGLEVQSIEPNQFVIELDRVVQGLRPVEASLVGEPAAGAVVLSSELDPQQVLISGPESLVDQVTSLVTTDVGLDGHAINFEETARVVSPNAQIQIVHPLVVTVIVTLEVPTGGDNR